MNEKKNTAGMITRTIITYKYTIGTIEMVDGNPNVNIADVFTSPKKMGTRLIYNYIKEKSLEGNKLLFVDEIEKKYAMSIDKFIEYADEI